MAPGKDTMTSMQDFTTSIVTYPNYKLSSTWSISIIVAMTRKAILINRWSCLLLCHSNHKSIPLLISTWKCHQHFEIFAEIGKIKFEIFVFLCQKNLRKGKMMLFVNICQLIWHSSCNGGAFWRIIVASDELFVFKFMAENGKCVSLHTKSGGKCVESIQKSGGKCVESS